MPTIQYQGKSFEVKKGANLKKSIAAAGLTPYNGMSRFFNCKGLGTCGTCAVEIAGEISEKTKVEKWRLSFPPHQEENQLRLSCQVKVLGDLVLKKHEGFWGQSLPAKMPLTEDES